VWLYASLAAAVVVVIVLIVAIAATGGSSSHPVVADISLAQCGVDSVTGQAGAYVAIHNHTSHASYYDVTVAFDSPDGTRHFGTGDVIVTDLAPGHTDSEEAVADGYQKADGTFDCTVTRAERDDAFPLAGATTTPLTSPLSTTPPSTTPPSTTPPSSPLPAGIVRLVKLLPDDLPVASGCSPASPPAPLPGSVSEIACTGDSGLPASTIYAYQFDGRADYVAGLAAYNRAKNFDPTTASPSCPPPTSAVGQQTWNNQLYPTRNDQILECFTQSGTDTPTTPTYIWTIPTQFVFVEAVSGPTTTFNQLDTWWTNHAGPFN